MAIKQTSDKLSYGITFLIFGVLYLLDKVNVLAQIPYGERLISVGAFFLIAGIVFVITQPKKVWSWLLLAVGVFLNSDIFFGWVSQYSKFIVPLALIVVGIVMILSSKKN